MSHLPLSPMNRFNKTESTVFKLWMLYFQRIFLTDYSEVTEERFAKIRICFSRFLHVRLLSNIPLV